MSEKIGFVLDIFLIAAISLLQSLNLISFAGIKPNLILVFLIISIFSVKDFWQYIVLVIISLFFLNYFSIFSKELIIFGAIMILAYYSKILFSEHAFFSILLLILFLTPVFYLLIDPLFIFNNFNVFIKELIFNFIAGLIFSFLIKNPF